MEPHAPSIRPSLRLITPFPSIKEVRMDTQTDTRREPTEKLECRQREYIILFSMISPSSTSLRALSSEVPIQMHPPPSSGRDGRTKQLGDVLQHDGWENVTCQMENVHARQTEEGSVCNPSSTNSGVESAQSSVEDVPGYQASCGGVRYQHIFGTTSVIEPSLSTGDCIAI